MSSAGIDEPLTDRRTSGPTVVSPTARPSTSAFSGRYSHRTIEGGIGHNLPQEAPKAFADAVLEVGRTRVSSAVDALSAPA
jgi:hypothetical protein